MTCHIFGCTNDFLGIYDVNFEGQRYEHCSAHSDKSFVWSGEAFEYYRLLEGEFLRTNQVLPLTPGQETLPVHSRPLAEMLVRVCGQIELVFRDWLNHYQLDSVTDIDRFRSDNSRVTIDDYADLFASKLNDQNYSTVKIRPLAICYEPFKNWTKGAPPKWWSAHNRIKHNGYLHRNLGTLENLIHSLAGLFLINCRHPNAHHYLQKYYLPFQPDQQGGITRTIEKYFSPLHEREYLFSIKAGFSTTFCGEP